MDQTEDALAQIREVVEEFPDSPRALGTLGLVLSRLAQWEDAAEALEQAVELAPDDPTHLANLGLVLERMGNSSRSPSEPRTHHRPWARLW